MSEAGVQAYEDALASLTHQAPAALAHWGIAPRSLQLVKFRENAVYRVEAQDGTRFALRFHRCGYHSDAALRSELRWMSALQEAGIDVPRVVPAMDGRLFISICAEGFGGPLQVDLFEWIDGRPLGTSEEGVGGDAAQVEDLYRTLGGMSARLHNQATEWPLPPGFTRHHWDAEGLVGEQPFWGRFWELAALTPDERTLVVAARDCVRRELSAFAASVDPGTCYSLIHADFVPENLLLAQGKVRLLDFDDAGFGWHLFDLATALWFIQDDEHYEAAREALVAGYREFRALPDDLLARLPVFMMARGFTYLGWVHTRPGSREAAVLTPYLVRLACRFAERLLHA